MLFKFWTFPLNIPWGTFSVVPDALLRVFGEVEDWPFPEVLASTSISRKVPSNRPCRSSGPRTFQVSSPNLDAVDIVHIHIIERTIRSPYSVAVSVDEPTKLSGRTTCWVWFVHWMHESFRYRCRLQRWNYRSHYIDVEWNRTIPIIFWVYNCESAARSVTKALCPPLFGNESFIRTTLRRPETVFRWPTMSKDVVNQSNVLYRTNIARRHTVHRKYMLVIVCFRSFMCIDWPRRVQIVVDKLPVSHVSN